MARMRTMIGMATTRPMSVGDEGLALQPEGKERQIEAVAEEACGVQGAEAGTRELRTEHREKGLPERNVAKSEQNARA